MLTVFFFHLCWQCFYLKDNQYLFFLNRRCNTFVVLPYFRWLIWNIKLWGINNTFEIIQVHRNVASLTPHQVSNCIYLLCCLWYYSWLWEIWEDCRHKLNHRSWEVAYRPTWSCMTHSTYFTKTMAKKKKNAMLCWDAVATAVGITSCLNIACTMSA